MKAALYTLIPRSRSTAQSRLVGFDLCVQRAGAELGGHNVQIVIGAPDEPRRGLSQEVAMILDSGWWVSLRNQFAQAPSVAVEIIRSAEANLDQATASILAASGVEEERLIEQLFETTFPASGPDYWR
jgi:hypothetical protein